MDDATREQDNVARLLDFLRGRDVPCPLCGYNLRDLVRPQCPECRHELLLTVGTTKPRFLWFLLAMAPCTFSVIAAALLLIPIVVSTLVGGGTPPPGIFALDGVGWLSGLGGVVLIRHRFDFLRRTLRWQRSCAAAVWGAHILAFLIFLTVVLV